VPAGQLSKDMPTPPTYHETNPPGAPILVLGLSSDTLSITTVDDDAESIPARKLSPSRPAWLWLWRTL
jgi:hypothetical protein